MSTAGREAAMRSVLAPERPTRGRPARAGSPASGTAAKNAYVGCTSASAIDAAEIESTWRRRPPATSEKTSASSAGAISARATVGGSARKSNEPVPAREKPISPTWAAAVATPAPYERKSAAPAA